jgi:Acyclic terpene utilisation family protein AtuA
LPEPIRIGGGSAFFIDSALAVPQLLGAGIDYIILDYLAEGAMGLLGRMRAVDPASGFPPDFMDVHIGPFLERIAVRGTKIVANAGGVNPAALVKLLRNKIAASGLSLKVACVAGDDLIECDWPDLPGGLTSVNAYLGAFPIAQALGQGADIVIAGRVVDSALALGPLIHEFGWSAHDFAKLAGGTVAGHLIECGAQVTGGTFTDWRDVEGWANIGSPIAECFEDGSCIITKPEGTGGLVSIGTVAEQLLYEVGDPQAYFVPDVTVDFSTVALEQVGQNCVRVTGATGYPPTDTLKVCATFDDGWRAIAYQPVIGPAAREKAAKQADALFERGRSMLRARGLGDWRHTEVVMIGGGEEVVAKLVVEHDEALAVQMFAREQFTAISAMAPGTSVSFGVQVQPCMGLVSFLIPKADVRATVDGAMFAGAEVGGFDLSMIKRPVARAQAGTAANLEHPRSTGRRLEDLAFTRSGEKGETINIAVIARRPEYLPILRAALTETAIAAWLADLAPSRVTIYDVPGIHALNIVLEGALPGGINASQRLDPAAKSVGQRLLGFDVELPESGA